MKLIKCIEPLLAGAVSFIIIIMLFLFHRSALKEGRTRVFYKFSHLSNYRYNKQQKYTKSIHLLHDGAVSLMQHKQYASGSDLANYMLDTYNLGNIVVDEKTLGTLYKYV